MLENFSEKLPKFRIDQFNDQFYKHAINSFDELTNWSKPLRDKLKQEIEFSTLEFEKEFISKRKDTIKVLFKRKKDGQRIETVLMRHKDGRNTVCVSCMVGCPVNCSFCATGKMGYGGSLSAEEIIDQIMHFQRFLKNENQKVSNVVFMGMGEPMLNLRQVQKAIDVMTDPGKLAMSHRRITISTSGYITQFKKLIKNGFKGRLAISLHAPNQELRAKMMPVAKLFPLEKLMNAIDEFVAITNKRVTYEYVLIKNLNDNPENAMELGELFGNRLHHINLIPYNPIREAHFERSGKDRISTFTKILNDFGINYTLRVTMGDDVNAACGQLADRENKKHVEKKIV
jgi:23S rRNA (adenine2503-C2)-methyltransferase